MISSLEIFQDLLQNIYEPMTLLEIVISNSTDMEKVSVFYAEISYVRLSLVS